ncbi:MAG: copper resistance protein CopC [Verrucomicrobiota bacterium]|nr:copper resistance protein CopC [Verrucomicrobiota bacterium]
MKSILQITPLRSWIPAVVLFLATQAPAGAHAFLDYSVPKVGSTPTNSPAEVKIWFTEHLKPHGSTIQVLDARGKTVDKKDSHRDFKDAALLRVSLPKLPPGAYRVFWRAIAEDGHRTQGHFRFTIKRP